MNDKKTPTGFGEERTNPLAEVIGDPENVTLDRVMAVAPSQVSDKDLDALIHSMRNRRSMFIRLEEEKKEPDVPEPREIPEW